MTPKAIQALAEFLPAFSQTEFSAGEWGGGQEIAPGAFQMPFFGHSRVVSSFVETAYFHNWVLADGFDWAEWVQSEEAQTLFHSESALADASAEQLARLLTVCIRRDRFVEGALAFDFEEGLIFRIVTRAAALFRDLRPFSPPA